MTLTDEQRKLLQLHGFTIDCEDPFEISLQRGVGQATGEAAEILLLLLEAENKRDVETDKQITERFQGQLSRCMEYLKKKHFRTDKRALYFTPETIEAIITDYFKP